MDDRDITVRRYLLVYASLIILLALTTWLAFVDLTPMNATVTLGIAATKAVLVILFFMHVRTASRLTRVFVVMGFYWLALLFGGSLGDLMTRAWLSP